MASAILIAACFAIGTGVGMAERPDVPGIDAFRERPQADAGRLALQVAEALDDDPELQLRVARVYLLSGDRPRARRIIERIERQAPTIDQMRMIGLLYAEAGESARADEYFRRVLAVDPRDEHALSQIGAAKIRLGDRVEGEALLARAFALDGKDDRHWVRAAEAYLGVRATK